jgi:chemotaxis-related protein WspB
MSESLFLLFSLGAERYACLPPRWRGAAADALQGPARGTPGWPACCPTASHVPVIDLSMLALGRPAARA